MIKLDDCHYVDKSSICSVFVDKIGLIITIFTIDTRRIDIKTIDKDAFNDLLHILTSEQ